MESQNLAMQELTMEQVEQVAGGDFSPRAAAFAIGIASAAAGGALFGPFGAAGAAGAYLLGYGGGTLFLRPMFQ